MFLILYALYWTGREVFLIRNGVRHGFMDMQALNALHYNPKHAVKYPETLINAIPKDNKLLTSMNGDYINTGFAR